ncbi:MAG TPA: ABC transporter permease [Candidatus Methylomirabilis sp.]|nr:ABC transporter permease [Candidatus Methylomirabilis sp.]
MKRYDARRLNLLRELTVAQHTLKDQSTFGGLLWSLLNPLFMVGVLFVFVRGWQGGTVEPSGASLLLGVVAYTYFANATSGSMRVLFNMKPLTREAVFPKELLVLSSTISHTIDFLVATAVCLLAAFITGMKVSWTALPLAGVVLLEFLVVLWVSLVLSCLYLVARDLEHLYQVFLRALLFLTPVFYPRSLLGHGVAHDLVALNPLAQVIDLARAILFDGAPSLGRLFGLLAINGLLVAVAFRLFRAFEPRLAEYV